MRVERHKNILRTFVAALMAATAVIVLCVTVAFGETVLDYDANRTENPVADNITRLRVEKLEKGAREPVVGARMCIIEKETGRVITEWITDGTPHQIDREVGDKSSLNIDTVYILRELEAPEGYEKAADTEFVLQSNNEFNTVGEILNGPDADCSANAGTGYEQYFAIRLYDAATMNVEDVERRERTNSDEVGDEVHTSDKKTETQTTTKTETTEKTSERLAQTSDDTPFAAMAGMAWAGAICLAAGVYLHHRQMKQEA